MSGFVSFVSFGPGDFEFLIFKVVDCLGKVDVVLFDDLFVGLILECVCKDVDFVGVGKWVGWLLLK